MVKDEERLHELVPHQLIDFKLAILVRRYEIYAASIEQSLK